MSEIAGMQTSEDWILLGWQRVWIALPRSAVKVLEDASCGIGGSGLWLERSSGRPCLRLDARLRPTTGPARRHVVFLADAHDAPGMLCDAVEIPEPGSSGIVALPPILAGDHPGIGLLAAEGRRVALVADVERLAIWLQSCKEGMGHG